MNQETCSFITDYHGNLNNVDPFLRQSAERRVQHIILGGDVAPKKMGVALSDNLAVKVDDFTDFAEHDFDVVGIAAKDLQNKGYMLFDSPCTLEDLQHLHSAVYKLSRGSGLSATESRLTWDEVLALEKIKDSYLLPYFKEGIRGMINKFISDYNKFNRGEPIKSVEEFLNGLIFRLKANTLLYNSDLHNSEKARLLFGSNATAEDMRSEKIFTYYELDTLGAFKLLGSLFNVMPWGEWKRMNNDLHIYAADKQKQFAQELIARIRDLRASFTGSISIILGNDDAVELSSDLDEADREGLLTHATNRVVQLSPTVQMVGYSHVPHHSVAATYREWCKEESEIEADLRGLLQGIRPEVAITIANMHSPPSGTSLGRATLPNIDNDDWGSAATRKVIAEYSQLFKAVFCGHIHNSWRETGEVQDNVSGVTVMNPGASEFEPRYLFGDLRNPEDFEVVAAK